MKKKYVLKRNQDIEKVVKLGKSVGNKYYLIFFLPNNLNEPKVAVSVSKKFGNAVKRNYEKRVVRSILRDNFTNLPNCSILIIVKINAARLKYHQKKSQINYLINQIKKREEGV